MLGAFGLDEDSENEENSFDEAEGSDLEEIEDSGGIDFNAFVQPKKEPRAASLPPTQPAAAAKALPVGGTGTPVPSFGGAAKQTKEERTKGKEDKVPRGEAVSTAWPCGEGLRRSK